jgi:hypothetical protein
MPYRIGLVAFLALAAIWFTFLRPKPPEASAPPKAPGMTGLGNAVKGAHGAVATSNGAAAQRSAAADAADATSPAGAATSAAGAAKPGKAAGAGARAKAARGDAASAPLLRQIDRGRVVVLLFSSRRGSDDAAVRAAVRGLPRHHGRVVVKRASLHSVGRYETITRGVKVLAAPTVLVIGAGPTARTITGFTTSAEIDQAVGDMLAAAKR